jgi:hypothetical protein
MGVNSATEAGAAATANAALELRTNASQLEKEATQLHQQATASGKEASAQWKLAGGDAQQTGKDLQAAFKKFSAAGAEAFAASDRFGAGVKSDAKGVGHAIEAGAGAAGKVVPGVFNKHVKKEAEGFRAEKWSESKKDFKTGEADFNASWKDLRDAVHDVDEGGVEMKAAAAVTYAMSKHLLNAAGAKAKQGELEVRRLGYGVAAGALRAAADGVEGAHDFLELSLRLEQEIARGGKKGIDAVKGEIEKIKNDIVALLKKSPELVQALKHALEDLKKAGEAVAGAALEVLLGSVGALQE